MASNRTNRKADQIPAQPVMTAAAALALLRAEARGDREDPVEPGYMTLGEWAEWLKVAKCTARPLLRIGIASRTVLFKKLRRHTPSGFRLINYYKLAKGAK